MFYEQTIQQSLAGFNEYQTRPIDGEGWATFDDLLTEIQQSVADQGGEAVALTDACPDWAEDIRGRIHDEPHCVLAIRWADGTVSYAGIAAIADVLLEG
jgi:hypothetical protein